jgi:hypothetical protein
MQFLYKVVFESGESATTTAVSPIKVNDFSTATFDERKFESNVAILIQCSSPCKAFFRNCIGNFSCFTGSVFPIANGVNRFPENWRIDYLIVCVE